MGTLLKTGLWSLLGGSLLLLLFLSSIAAAAPGGGPPLPLAALGQSDQVAPEVLESIKANGRTEVILLLETADVDQTFAEELRQHGNGIPDQALLAAKARAYRQRRQEAFAGLAPGGHTMLTEYDHLPLVHLRVNEQALTALLSSPKVAAIGPNRGLKPHLLESLPLINADLAQADGSTGLGTAVAILDTGLDYTRTAFGSCTAPGLPATCKVAFVQDFAASDNSLDDSGHGTNVSGIVAGVAPEADLLGLDVFAPDGYAYYADILAAVDWVIANRDLYNTVAVNMSFGGGSSTKECPSDSLARAIEDLKDAGIVSAVSAGNEGFTNALAKPACAPEALSVGAVYDSDLGSHYTSVCSDSTTAADQVTCYSNSASFLKVLAPGAWITAAGLTYSGTSQAAPHAAGGAALLKAAAPLLTVDEVISVLTNTGKPITDHRNGLDFPRLDVYAALNTTSPIIGYSPASLAFEVIRKNPLPPSQSLGLRNDGAAGLTWTVSDPAAWLSLSPTSGSENGEVTVSVTTSDLTAGTYATEIVIDSPEAINSPQTVPVTYTVRDPLTIEDFESGDLNKLPWRTTGDGAWAVQSSTVHEGVYSAASPALVAGQTGELEVTVNVTATDFLTFWLKTDTGTYYNTLYFLVDGVNYGPWDGWYGTNNWQEAQSLIEIEPGFHTFSWKYEKLEETGTGAWIDLITFPPFNLEVPAGSLTPTAHDFGSLAVGTTSPARTFTVTNGGAGSLTISSISIQGTDSTQFAVQNDGCTGLNLAASQSCFLDLAFAPSATGAKSAELRVTTNDPATSTVTAALNGTGLQTYTLYVSKTGTGSGTMTSSPAGIDCGPDCSETYLAGEQVTLSAAPAADSVFIGWTGGGCSGTGTCMVTLSANNTVTATFDLLPPDLALTSAAHDFGTVEVGTISQPQTFTILNQGVADLVLGTISLTGIDRGEFALQNDGCSNRSLAAGTSCTLEAVFTPLSGGAKSAELAVPSNDPDTPSVTAALSGTGQQTYTLSVLKDGTGSGAVSSLPAGIDCGSDCGETYPEGELIILSGAPDADSSFSGWSGGACSGTTDCTITMTVDLAVTAFFDLLPPVADFSADPVTGAAPLIVDFTDLSANAPTSWAWDFGDLETTASRHPTHIYQYEGTYSPSLTATNVSGSDILVRTDLITATACPNLAVRIGPDFYPGLQAAYNDAAPGEIIEAQALPFSEDLLLNREVAVTLAGGNNCEYTRSAMGTVIQGTLTISGGTVVVEGMLVQ